MSDPADSIPQVTQDTPGHDVSSAPPPPLYSNEEPPPYSAAPAMYPPPNIETTCTPELTTDYKSCNEAVQEATVEETPGITSSAFDDDTVKRAFVRKVFSILTLQLLFTFSVVCVFTFSSVVKEAVQENFWIYLSSFFVFLVVALMLICCKSFSRRHPWNIVGLFVVTLSLSYMVGTVASFHDTGAVIIAMVSTLVITVTIIAFSAQTRFQFSICNGLLLVLVVNVLMFGFFSCFTFYFYMADVGFGFLGALLFSMFLMVDCQLLMGNRSNSPNPEEYVTAALIIYLDIIFIFVYLMGKR